MNFYNEFDQQKAAWLRKLIRGGLIPLGRVDTRDIREIRASDLHGYTQCHFFAGIGGWPLALSMAGWPEDEPVWTGSCPCQPFSGAGKRMGTKDSRHLFPAFRKLIARSSPSVVLGEQVASSDGREWLSRVHVEMASLGYAVRASDLCAAGVASPQLRQRLYWVADTENFRWVERDTPGRRGLSGKNAQEERLRPSFGGIPGGLASSNGGQPRHGELQPGGQHGQQPENSLVGGLGDDDDARSQGLLLDGHSEDQRTAWETGMGHWDSSSPFPCTDGFSRRVEPAFFPLAYGVPCRMGLIRGAGDAIVPQLAAVFIRAYRETRRLHLG